MCYTTFRKYFRLVTVIAVLLAANFVLLPAAEARGLSGSRPAVHSTSYFEAALAWMTDLLGLGHPSRPAAPTHLSSASFLGGGTGGYVTNTGPCIDPNGIRCNPIN
jgi:hypothetical protein